MLSYQQIEKKPSLIKNLTGLTQNAFTQLIPAFLESDQNDLDKKDQNRKPARQRRRGGGRKPTLKTISDCLLFILFYFKFYPTQEVLGF